PSASTLLPYTTLFRSYYFSRGISTGTTNNGRRGNQLTQAAVTGAADDLQPHRPAQLYGAKHWALEKADGTVCEPWFAPLELYPADRKSTRLNSSHVSI